MGVPTPQCLKTQPSNSHNTHNMLWAAMPREPHNTNQITVSVIDYNETDSLDRDR